MVFLPALKKMWLHTEKSSLQGSGALVSSQSVNAEVLKRALGSILSGSKLILHHSS